MITKTHHANLTTRRVNLITILFMNMYHQQQRLFIMVFISTQVVFQSVMSVIVHVEVEWLVVLMYVHVVIVM